MTIPGFCKINFVHFTNMNYYNISFLQLILQNGCIPVIVMLLCVLCIMLVSCCFCIWCLYFSLFMRMVHSTWYMSIGQHLKLTWLGPGTQLSEVKNTSKCSKLVQQITVPDTHAIECKWANHFTCYLKQSIDQTRNQPMTRKVTWHTCRKT